MPSGRVYWVDRSLGGAIVPDALRGAGVAVKVYADLYDDPKVLDVVWIPEVAGRGWVILTKDKYIRRSPVEVAALRRANACYVCLSSKNMRGDEQAACLLEHWKTVDSLRGEQARSADCDGNAHRGAVAGRRDVADREAETLTRSFVALAEEVALRGLGAG